MFSKETNEAAKAALDGTSETWYRGLFSMKYSLVRCNYCTSSMERAAVRISAAVVGPT